MHTASEPRSDLEPLLRCPACRGRLERHGHGFRCRGDGCGAAYPVVNDVPVLIHEPNSVFSIADYEQQRDTFFKYSQLNPVLERLKRLLPELYGSPNTHENYRRLAALLLETSSRPRVLVIGGSILGSGVEELLTHPGIELVDTDVAFGPRTRVICDAHDLPFADGGFDGVIAQAVLEHVVDPHRCVAEVHRVLTPRGLVYAETPFMYPAHGEPYDFTRFTLMGHRRLFRRFEEVASGATGGPGSTLALVAYSFLRALARGRTMSRATTLVSRVLFAPLKWLDTLRLTNPLAFEAAAGFFFLGRRSDEILCDRELVRRYGGAPA
jgi:SAM-dependent methyltransferase